MSWDRVLEESGSYATSIEQDLWPKPRSSTDYSGGGGKAVRSMDKEGPAAILRTRPCPTNTSCSY